MIFKDKSKFKFIGNFLFLIIFIFSISPLMNQYLRRGTDFKFKSHGISIYVSKLYSREEKDSIFIQSVITEAITKLHRKNITEAEWNVNAYFYYTEEEWKRKSLYFMTDNPAKTHSYLNFMMFNSASFLRNTMDDCDSTRYVTETLAHELTHIHEYRKLGILKYMYHVLFCKWKIEGFSDFVAGRAMLDTTEYIGKFLNKETDSSVFYTDYFSGHLRTDYLIRHKGVSEDEYWDTVYDTDSLDDEIRQSMKRGKYKFKSIE